MKYPKEWLLKSNYLKYRQSTHFEKIDNKQLKPNNIVVMNMGIFIKNEDKKIFILMRDSLVTVLRITNLQKE